MPTAHAADAPSGRRRTSAGDDRAEARIARDLVRVGDAVRDVLGARLSALLLVGGYARGEGGLVDREGSLGPYNDYDLVAVTNGLRARGVRTELLALGHRLTEEIGVEVELWPVDGASLSTLPPTLFWLDVALGGVEVLRGDPAILTRLPQLSARSVPHVEAARLLANRAVGIALSNLESQDHDLRRARHGHKAILACGDACLLAADRYAGTVSERNVELSRLASSPAIGDALRRAYADAARFRARPDAWRPPDGEPLDAWYERVVSLVGRAHLAYERRRIGTPLDPAGYARHRGPLFRDAPDVSIGAVAALRAALRRRAPLLPFLGHPRERLARVAVALAYGFRGDARAAAARLLDVAEGSTDAVLHASLSRLTEVGG